MTSSDLFPRLPVLEATFTARDLGALAQVGLVCCQHLLETTGSLIEGLLRHGLKPEHTFVLGKVYSTNDGVKQRLVQLGCCVIGGSTASRPGTFAEAIRADADQLWKQATRTLEGRPVQSLILLDDGAHICRSLPAEVRSIGFKVAGIEQTTGGLLWHGAGHGGIPVINVASSAAKRLLEPPLICGALLARVRSLAALDSRRLTCGVIGLGKIGATVASALRDDGFSILAFDSNRQRLKQSSRRERTASVAELIERSAVVFGCTGRDVVSPEDFAGASGVRTLASCSSGDVEFRSLLQGWSWRPVQADREQGPTSRCPTLDGGLHDGQLQVRVLRSGYPVNFDNSEESVPASEIQLTRGLLLVAILQALELLQRDMAFEPASIMLDPAGQRNVVDVWRRDTPDEIKRDVSWYEQNSRGLDTPV